MDIQQVKKNDILIIRLNGRLDSNSSQDFEQLLLSLIESGNKKISLDFGRLEYISSAGLRALLVAQKKIKNISGGLSLFSLNENILEIFETSGFSSLFEIYKNENGLP